VEIVQLILGLEGDFGEINETNVKKCHGRKFRALPKI
jgi:hypothetical protein